MIKDIETLGLKVESIRPSTNKHEVDTKTDIKIKFNADVLANTILGNVCVYEDTNSLFNGEIDTDKLTRINGEISYESKTIIFTPKEELRESKQYIIIVSKNGLKDIIGRSLLEDNISTFFTKSNKSLPKPSIVKPINASVIDDNPVIEFTDLSDIYNVQISKSIDFNSYVVNDIVNTSNTPTVKYIPNKELEDGLYYIRIKTSDSIFSDTVQVYIQRNSGLVTDEDYSELLKELDSEQDINLIDMFPKKDKLSGVNINSMYLKFSGKVDIEKVNINKSSFIGELFDETDEDTIVADGYLDLNLITIYDDIEDVTYIINKVGE